MPPKVLSISSRVSLGNVGNTMIERAFAREAPHIPLHTIDAVQWTAPGNHPRRAGIQLDEKTMRDMLAMLLAPKSEEGAACDTVITGYLPGPRLVDALLSAITNQLLIVDPVMGDHGRLYIPAEAAEAIRDRLAPRADYLLPNLTEARYLAGNIASDEPPDALLATLHARYPRAAGIIITSAPAPNNHIGIIASDGTHTAHFSDVHLDRIIHGAGDLYTGLFSAHLLAQETPDLHQTAHRAHDILRRRLEA